MPLKKHGQLYQYGGTPYENLGTLCSNLGMLSLFEGTPYEGEKGIREESRGHRAVLPVPHPFRKARCRREEPLSQRQATLRALLGTPSMRFGMPNEERTMPTVKPGSPRPHPPSLQRFLLEELAPFAKEGSSGQTRAGTFICSTSAARTCTGSSSKRRTPLLERASFQLGKLEFYGTTERC